ncbi:hypothetical protein ACVWXL_005384 [Bradyrhizobium sp. GM22.5]
MKLLRGRPATTFFSAASQALRSKAASVPGFGTVVAKVGGTMMTTGTSAGNALTISASAAISGNVARISADEAGAGSLGQPTSLNWPGRPDVLVADKAVGVHPWSPAKADADALKGVLDGLPGDQACSVSDDGSVIEPVGEWDAALLLRPCMRAPARVSHDHQCADLPVIPQEEVQHREFLAGERTGHVELHESQAGCARQFRRLDHLRRRITQDRGIEIRIPRAARGRDFGQTIIDAVDAKQAELAAVIGIDRHHQCEHQQRSPDQRAQTRQQAPAPAGIGLRT